MNAYRILHHSTGRLLVQYSTVVDYEYYYTKYQIGSVVGMVYVTDELSLQSSLLELLVISTNLYQIGPLTWRRMDILRYRSNKFVIFLFLGLESELVINLHEFLPNRQLELEEDAITSHVTDTISSLSRLSESRSVGKSPKYSSSLEQLLR